MDAPGGSDNKKGEGGQEGRGRRKHEGKHESHISII